MVREDNEYDEDELKQMKRNHTTRIRMLRDTQAKHNTQAKHDDSLRTAEKIRTKAEAAQRRSHQTPTRSVHTK